MREAKSYSQMVVCGENKAARGPRDYSSLQYLLLMYFRGRRLLTLLREIPLPACPALLMASSYSQSDLSRYSSSSCVKLYPRGILPNEI